MRYIFKNILKSFFVSLIVIIFSSVVNLSAYAATLYVNGDSNGTASNPNRSFNDSSYIPNDSYQSMSAAYNAASTGDTIEFSGGVNGKTYISNGGIGKANLTIQGSSVPNFNGPVTLDYNTGLYTIGFIANNITLQNVTIVTNSASNPVNALSLYNPGAVIKRVRISNVSQKYFDTGNASVYINSGATNAYFENCVIDNFGVTGMGIYLDTSSGTTVFNNCTINNSANFAVIFNSPSTISFTNSVFTSNGTITNNLFTSRVAGAVINTANSFIQGPANWPQVMTQGVTKPTWNSINDSIDGFPYYTKTKANAGYISFVTDDYLNVNYFTTIASYAMSTYGIPLTYFVDEAEAPLNNLTNDQSFMTKLQSLEKAGHDIEPHTKYHNDLSLLNGITVTYSGANSNMAIVVSGGGNSLSISGTSDIHGPIDLTNSPNNTLAGICSTISAFSNFTCSVISNILSTTLSNDLKDATTLLPQNIPVGVPFDDDTSAANRYYSDDITGNINHIENALHADPALFSYKAKILAFPYNRASAAVINWVKFNTNLIGARENYSIGSPPDHKWLGRIDVFNAYDDFTSPNAQGPNYNTLTNTQKQTRMQQAAKVMATYASNGFYTGMLNHNPTSNLSVQDFEWFLDEAQKYRTQYNIKIDTFANVITDITTSGNWIGEGSGFWDRTFTGIDDLSLTSQSPMINIGTTIPGRTVDILGNPIIGLPDVGAYEFQPSITPTPTPTVIPSVTATPTPTPSVTPIPTFTPTPTLSPNYVNTVITDAPAAYWRLGETSGTLAINTIGATYTGTYTKSPSLGQTGAIFGDSNKAVKFNGTNSYVQIPYNSQLNTNIFTIELWAKATTTSSTYRGVVSSRNFPFGWVLYQNTANKWSFWINNASDMPSLTASANIISGNWYYLVGTFDGTTAKFYVNGVLAASTSITSYQANNNNSFTIGQGQPSNNFWFNGTVDEVAYYSQALTSTQISTHYAKGIGN